MGFMPDGCPPSGEREGRETNESFIKIVISMQPQCFLHGSPML
jgi:hypothetical protein